jgi:hypothetical protein
VRSSWSAISRPSWRSSPTTFYEENVAAASISLDAMQMSTLDEALAPGKVAGPRYNPATMATIDR